MGFLQLSGLIQYKNVHVRLIEDSKLTLGVCVCECVCRGELVITDTCFSRPHDPEWVEADADN